MKTSTRVASWAAHQLERGTVHAQRVAVEVAAEFRKHPVATLALVLLCLIMYPRQTLTVLVGLGVVLALAMYGVFWLWSLRWKAALRDAERDIPNRKELRVIYRKLQKREKKLLEDWPTLCTMNGLHSNKRTPLLLNVAPTIDLDFQAFVPRTGFDPDDIKAKSTKLAKGLGCQSVVVRETAPGCAEIKFNWTNSIRRELPLRELQMPKNGGIAVGHTESGEPAELRMDASKVFVGVMGSGKSNGAEAALADLVRRGEWVRLFVSNPKKNEMRAFKEFEKQAMGRLEVRAYAESEQENVDLLKQFHHAMGVRNGMMKGRKLTKTTKENPLCILWLDEMMMLPKETYAKGPFSLLGQCCLAGRASLYVVWGCTQMFYAADFGSIRGLFDERIMFRVKTATQADTVIDGATARGALAHLLHPRKDRGVGWIEDENSTDLVKFRAAHVTDADLDNIIRGITPDGMVTESGREMRRVAVYQIWGFKDEAGRRELKYIGQSNEPLRRRQEHIDNPSEPWWSTVDDPSNECDPETFEWYWCDSKADADVAERDDIQRLGPTKNTTHNRRNPMRHARDWIVSRTINNDPKPPKPHRETTAEALARLTA